MTRKHLTTLAILCMVVVMAGPAVGQKTKKKRSAFEPVEDNPKLPRVLLIGDSISIGYTLAVREELKGVANVHRPKGNCAGTIHGLKELEKWLGDGKWDVIHFNWGLHDLKYIDDANRLTDVGKGKQQSALPQYKKNLEQLVERLEKTGAKLIFAATTPVPNGAKGRVPGDEQKYNAAAVTIMKEHKIQVNDLCAFVETLPDECKLEANVHYSSAGSKRLGSEVAKVIAKAMEDAN